ncbi:MAG TPA: hypothetical protein VGT79_00740 [Xanthomonadaceae bacterium]|nr:hypothetical protein [Xanthomonadaceae bacterium]
MRKLEVLPKAGLYSLPLQSALVCVAFLFRDSASEVGAWLIFVSWLPGLVGFFSGIVLTFTTRRIRWLGLSFAAFVVWCASVFYLAGFGL